MAKQLWFVQAVATSHRGDNTAKLDGAASWWRPRALSEARGPSASPGFTAVGTPVNGPTPGVEFTLTPGPLPVEWVSEPLSADFTIAGTITLNLWAAENGMNDNCAVNAVVEKIDGATGALTQIALTARVTELAVTTRAVNNFTVTPTSTACKRGDRLRVRLFIDDVGTMAVAAGGCSFSYDCSGAGVDGDSWIQFTETLTFEAAGNPTGSTYYLTDTAESINPGSAAEKVASTSRGSGSTTAVTNTTTGPTAPIQITNSGGGTALEWYSPALEAVSFGGKAKFNIRALESNAAANASLIAEIAITAGDGSGAAAWGRAGVETASNAEPGITDAVLVAWVSGDDVSITAGQRLRFRIYVDDSPVAALVTGFTVTVSYNGTTASAAGDTYVILPVAVVEQVSGTAWTQPVNDTLSLADNTTTESGKTAAIPDTLALADALATQADFARTIPDTLALADAQTIARDIAQAIADTLSLADATAVARDIAQAVVDTLALADSATTAAGKGATVNDTLALADAQTFDRAITVADTVALSDVVAQAEEIHIADTLSLADLCDPVKSTGSTAWTQPIADTLSVADALAFDRAQQVADTLAVADSLASQAVLQRALADTVSVADSLATTAALLRTVADTVSLADAQTVALDRSLALADTLSLADALATTAAFLRTVADTLAIIDAVTTTGSGAQTVADTVTVSDALRFDRTLNLADTVAVVDQLVAQVALARTIADTLALADSLVAERGLTRSLADTVSVADLLVSQLARGLALADTVSLADELAFQATLERLLADTLTLTDELTSDSIVPTPLPPGRVDFGRRGHIDRHRPGRIDYTNRGRLGSSRAGRLSRTVTHA